MIEFPNIENLSYIEALWRRYLSDPASIDDEWRDYFERSAANGNDAELPSSSKFPRPAPRNGLARSPPGVLPRCFRRSSTKWSKPIAPSAI